MGAARAAGIQTIALSARYWDRFYPAFLITGLFSFFGQTVTAVPFLLDLLRLPADLFHVFVAVDVINSRFGVMLAAMYTVCLSLLGAFAISGELRVRALPLLRFAATSAVALLAVLLSARLLFAHALDLDAGTYQKFIEMDFRGAFPPAELVTQEPPVPGTRPSGNRLPAIETRGRLRVCYVPDALPYAFVNAEGRLVGFDVEMAHELAKELGVGLEFVRVPRARIVAHLDGGTCDLAMSGMAITTGRARELLFSTPYLDNTLAFVVEDHLRQEFSSWERLRARPVLRIFAPQVPYYVALVQERLPNAELVAAESIRPYFDHAAEYDALLYSAEAGSAWTLIHPEFAVALPSPGRIAVPLAYAMARDARDLVEFVDTWIHLKENDGTIDALFDHWIVGRAAEDESPRWSVLRNVLHRGEAPDAEDSADASGPSQ